MEVNEQCVGSFLSSLEEIVDFSQITNNKDYLNQSDQVHNNLPLIVM